MTEQADLSPREVEQDLSVICSFLKSSDPDRNVQGGPMLGTVMKRFRESPILRTKSGAGIYDLMSRARENIRIGCVDDALLFLMEARDMITGAAAGEKEC